VIGYLIHGTWRDLTTVPLLARLSNPPDKRYPDTRDDVLHDGEEVRLGRTVLVAHKTPGTRGCTTWTMRVWEWPARAL